MEVLIPLSSMDFDFNSARSSPHVSTPSSPKRFGDYYLSAPTSPTRLSEFYSGFDDFCVINDSKCNEGSLAIPFSWEEKPGTPKSAKAIATKNEDDFAFDFSKELEKASLPAEELFDNGKIRPLKPPPRLQLEEWEKSPLISPRSPRSPKWQGIREAFSPRKKKDIDPFATAAENTRKRIDRERGRERTSALSSSSSRRATRSLSPLRVSQYQWEEEKQMQQTANQLSLTSKPSFQSTTSSSSSSSAKSSSRKWRLKDFFLFRSASEGRATDKDPFRNYASLFQKHEDVKNASIRSTDNSGSVSSSKRRGPVSAHELHYTMNKAASEDLKKKTFLPYKQGILGRLSFNPKVHAFGSFGR